MADEKTGTGMKLGAFHLGSAYEEVGPELGHLYEARHGETRKAALVLLPCTGVDWLLEDWQVRISSQREPAAMTLEVERAPASGGVGKLANLLVLMSAAVSRVEDNPQVEAHLRGVPHNPRKGWMGGWGMGSVMGLAVLALGLSWLALSSDSTGQAHASSSKDSKAVSQSDALQMANSDQPGVSTIAYPLPLQPFRNQAVAPCKPKLDEVEINGGCWVELARRPPCLKETQAEYQGKCYLPVSKDRGRPAQSVKP